LELRGRNIFLGQEEETNGEVTMQSVGHGIAGHVCIRKEGGRDMWKDRFLSMNCGDIFFVKCARTRERELVEP
jgi:hypothetical protein